jgi:hypothetical protein
MTGPDYTTAFPDVPFEPYRARQVVGCAMRQNTDRNIVSHSSSEEPMHRPVPAHRNQSELFGAMSTAERIDHNAGRINNQRNLLLREVCTEALSN